MKKRYWLFGLALILWGCLCWWLIHESYYAEYDENIGLVIGAFLLSLIPIVVLPVLWFASRPLFKRNQWVILFWFLTCSPITLFLVLDNWLYTGGAVMETHYDPESHRSTTIYYRDSGPDTVITYHNEQE